jgi:hypothetical protein
MMGELHNWYSLLKTVMIKIKEDGSVPVAARFEAKALIAWTSRWWVRIPLKALIFVLVFLCCVVL